MVIYHLENTFH